MQSTAIVRINANTAGKPMGVGNFHCSRRRYFSLGVKCAKTNLTSPLLAADLKGKG